MSADAEVLSWAFDGPRGRLPLHCVFRFDREVPREFDLYFWTISQGGRLRPLSEYRIQAKLPDGASNLRFGNGVTALLGYYVAGEDRSEASREVNVPPEMELFVAWDAAAHLKVGKSSSCQVAYSLMYEAYLQGRAQMNRTLASGSRETVVAFRPARLSEYLRTAVRSHVLAPSTGPAAGDR